MASLTFGPRVLTIVGADILDAAQGAEAVVSSDDNYLTHSGGVSARIWQGLQLEPAGAVPRLTLGDVLQQVVPARNGRTVEHVLHAITIDFDKQTRLTAWDATALYSLLFTRAGEMGVQRLCLPLLGAGAGRVAPEASATAMLDALDGLSLAASPLGDVRLAVLPDALETVNRVVESRRALAAVGKSPELLLLALGRLIDALAEAARHEWGTVSHPAAFPGLVRAGEEWVWSPAASEVSSRTGLERADSLLTTIGRGLKPSTRAALWAAVDAAEQLTSGRPAPGAGRALAVALDRVERERPDLFLSAITELLGGAGLAGLRVPGVEAGAVGVFGGAGAAINLVRAIVSPRAPAVRIPPEPSAGMPAQSGLAGRGATAASNAPVRRLRDFLLHELPSAELEDLLKTLEAEGYRGERDVRLLEFCVREDPRRVLTDRFTARQLRGFVATQTARTDFAGMEPAVVAQLLLTHLGFSGAERGDDLSGVMSMLSQARGRVVVSASREGISGEVTQAAARLEYVSAILIRFLCRVMFDTAAEPWLYERRLLDRGRTLDTASLGTLLASLEAVAKAVEKETPVAGAEAFRRSMQTRGLLPSGITALARLRNAFAHWHESAGGDVASARRIALEFFDLAQGFLVYLAAPETRIFPVLVTVDRIVVDRWGRRIIEATREGDVQERIFTDLEVVPGETYFMHPLSNPFRIDPVLVARGDLRSPGRA